MYFMASPVSRATQQATRTCSQLGLVDRQARWLYGTGLLPLAGWLGWLAGLLAGWLCAAWLAGWLHCLWRPVSERVEHTGLILQ